MGNKRSLGSLNRYGGELIRLVELDRGPRRITPYSNLARRCEHFPDSYGDEVHEKVARAASILVFVIRWGDLGPSKSLRIWRHFWSATDRVISTAKPL